MLEVRRSPDIHVADGGWFSARWHFSFDEYRDQANMGVGPLRVFNDDRLVAGATWPMHPHRDIDGITYVVEGTFRHLDSLGNDDILRPGSVQVMTLGSGAMHSESNASDEEPMRFLQLWILPDTGGLPPRNAQLPLDGAGAFTDRLRCVVAPAPGRGAPEEGEDETLAVHQDARMFIGKPSAGVTLTRAFPEARAGYLYLLEGAVTVNDSRLLIGDALKIYGPEELTMTAETDAHLVLVDVPREYRPAGVWARG